MSASHVAGGAIRSHDQRDVPLDAGQVLEPAHALAMRDQPGEGRQVDLGEDDVLGAHSIVLQELRVQLADPAQGSLWRQRC